MKDKDLYELINSSAIKECCKKNKTKFSLIEKAEIINNSVSLTIADIISHLTALIAGDEDMLVIKHGKEYSVKELVKMRVTYLLKLKEKLELEDNAVYELESISNEEKNNYYDEQGIFKTYDEVMQKVRSLKNENRYYIKKTYFEEPFKNIRAYLNSNGDLIQLDSYKVLDHKNHQVFNLNHFSATYSHPFEIGDIVVVRGLYTATKEDFISVVSNIKSGFIEVIYINELNQSFDYYDIDVMDLEYNNKKLVGYNKLLYPYSLYLKGRISLTNFLNLNDYLKKEVKICIDKEVIREIEEENGVKEILNYLDLNCK